MRHSFIAWPGKAPAPNIPVTVEKPDIQPEPGAVDPPKPDPRPRPPDWPGFEEAPPETVTMSFGGALAGQHVSVLRKHKVGFFSFGGYEPFSVRIIGNRFSFSFHAWGGDGEPPIEVQDNEFTIRRRDWDRNYSKNALEVVLADGTPVFQMIRKSSSNFQVMGRFITPSGLILADEQRMIGPGPIGQPTPFEFKLSPIFKYSSWKYPGEYAKN